MNEERRGTRVRFVYERLLRPKSVLRRTATQSTEEHPGEIVLDLVRLYEVVGVRVTPGVDFWLYPPSGSEMAAFSRVRAADIVKGSPARAHAHGRRFVFITLVQTKRHQPIPRADSGRVKPNAGFWCSGGGGGCTVLRRIAKERSRPTSRASGETVLDLVRGSGR